MNIYKDASNNILLYPGTSNLMSGAAACCCGCPTLDTAKTYTVDMTAVVDGGLGTFNYSIAATWTTISGYDVLVWSRYDACTSSDDCFQIWNRADFEAATGTTLPSPAYDGKCFVLAAAVDPTGAPCPTTPHTAKAGETSYLTSPWEIEWLYESGSPSDAGDCTAMADWTVVMTENP